MEKLLIIDGNSILYRGYYASLNNENREEDNPANGLSAFANILNKAIKIVKPKFCVVAFDKGDKTFRNELYPEYKIDRPEMPEDLKQQFI